MPFLMASELPIGSDWSHRKKSRSRPAIGKSTWHNVSQKCDQTLWYGSGILSCLCILSNLCSETQLFINRPLAQQYTTRDVLYDLYATQSVWHQLPHGTTGVGRLSATWNTQGLIASWFQNNTFWTLSEVMPVSDFRLNMLDEYICMNHGWIG